MHTRKMHIACPNCQAVYDVPQSMLEASTILRCHLCQHSWTLNAPTQEAEHPQNPPQPQSAEEVASPAVQMAIEPEFIPEPPQPGSPEPFAIPAPTNTSPPDYVVHLSKSTQSTAPHQHAKRTARQTKNTSNVLLGSAAVILAILTVALLARHGIVKAFPSSAAFFKALGIS